MKLLGAALILCGAALQCHALLGARRQERAALQELVQRQSGQVLSYELVGEEGPDHAKTFRMQVCLNGEPVGLGTGRTKKEAEQTAAASALEALRK